MESTLTEFGSSVDPLKGDLLGGLSGGLSVQRLSQGDNSLDWTWDGTLDHDEVVSDLTVSDKTTKRSNGLLGSVILGRTVGLIITLTNSVNLVVDRGSVVETVLTGSGNSPHNVGWMPSTNTSNLSQTSVGLSWKLLGSPSVGDTFETVTLGDSDNVNVLVLLKDGVNSNGLLEVVSGPVDLLRNGTTVDLDLSQVSSLLVQRGLSDLGVDEDSDNRSVLLDSGQLSLDRGWVVGVLGRVLAESDLLGLVPVLVESSSNIIRQVLSPDGGQRLKTAGGLNVTNDTDNNERWSVNNGDGLNNLTLVHLGTWTVQVSHDGGHTSLVTHEGGQSDWLGLVVLRESLTSGSWRRGSLLWQETKGTVTWSFKLSVRHYTNLVKGKKVEEKRMGEGEVFFFKLL